MSRLSAALDRVVGACTTRRAPLLLAAVTVVLALPTLRHGFQADDNVFHTLVSDGHHPWRLFYFSPSDIATAREFGGFPWWASEQLTFEFMRPLAGVMHWFEFTYFPSLPALMRVISIAIYALTVVFATLAYREVMPASRAAAMAALLFAVDDGHAVGAAWISARNTSLAALFSVLALLLHLKSRRAGAQWLAVASALATACALASAEAGIWALAYVIAAALVLETDSLRARVLRLLPHGLVTAAWLALYLSHDYGLHGSGWYRSLSSPLHVVVQGVLDLPLWLAAAFGPGNVDVAAAAPLWLGRLVAVPIAFACVACLVPVIRASKEAQFFALGTLGCIAPMFTTMPQDRLVIGASFGAFGLIGCFLSASSASAEARWGRWGRRFHLGLHACAAPLLFPVVASNPQLMQNTHLALTQAAAPGRDVVLIDSPAETLGYYAYHSLTQQARSHAAARSMQQLYAGRSDLWFERVDARTLDVRASLGWGSTPYETFFASAEELPKVGTTRRAGDMTMTVLEANDEGRPTHVRFEFPDTLESTHRAWLTWEGRGPVPWTPPAIGERTFVAGQTVLSALTL